MIIAKPWMYQRKLYCWISNKISSKKSGSWWLRYWISTTFACVSASLSVCVCEMYALLSVFVCIHTCVHVCVHVEVRGWFWLSSSFTPHPIFLRQGLSLNLELTDLARPPSEAAQGSSCFCLSISRIWWWIWPPLVFGITWVLGIRSSFLGRKHLTNLANSPILHQTFKKKLMLLLLKVFLKYSR